jgi:hypothetical protein
MKIMTDELKIQDVETEEVEKEKSAPKGNLKRDFYIELALILVLGFLIGVAVKTEANKRITIGFNDYKMMASSSQYDISALQASLANKNDSSGASQNSSDGAACTNNN